MSAREFTDDELETMFHAALGKADAKGIDACIRLLALSDPARAQRCLDLVQLVVDFHSIEHLTLKVTDGRYDADCSVCQTGVDVPDSFGGIPGETILAAFVDHHRHEKTRSKR